MTTSRAKAVCLSGNIGLKPDLIFPAEIRALCILQLGLAAGAAGADVGVEAATTEQGAAVATRWPLLIVGLKIESVSRLSACPGALAQRV